MSEPSITVREVNPSEYPVKSISDPIKGFQIPNIYEPVIDTIQPYSYHASKFKEHAILEANQQLNQTPTRIGLATLGFKSTYLGRKLARISVISDLSTLQANYPEQTLQKLLQRAVNVSTDRGCDAILTNLFPESEKPFTELGFRKMHTRVLAVNVQHQSSFKDVTVNKINPEEAEKHMKEYYTDSDLNLTSYDEYFKNPDYIGSYAAYSADRKNFIGGSVFKNSHLKYNSLNKFLGIPREHLNSKTAYFGFYAIASLVPASALFYMLNNGFRASAAILFPGLMFIGINILADLTINRVVFPPKPTSAQISGMYYFGNKDQEALLLNELMAGISKEVLKEHKISKLSVDVDKESTLHTFLKAKKKVEYDIYVKFIKPYEAESLQGNVFSDPRDF